MVGSMFSLPRADRSAEAWETRSLRSILAPRSERNRPDLPLLTVARERGVFVRSDSDANHNAIPEDLGNYKVALSGDLVINKMKAWQGSLGLAPVDGIVSPAYFVFEADFDVPRFGEYLMRSKPCVAKLGAASDGVRVGQWDLDIPRMRNIELSLPEAKEQAAIVKYLAHANSRIDKAIAVKRRLITLLREHVATLRHEAFGADTGRWPVIRLKALLSRIDQGVSPQAENQLPSENEWGVLKAGCVNGGVFRPDQIKRLPDGFDVPESLSVANGDILVARASGSADLVGSTARVADFQGNAILSDKIFRLVPRPLVDPDYLVMAMNSYSYRQQVQGAISGAEGLANNLPVTALRTFQFALPPIHQQREIVERLATESKSSSDTIVRIEYEITLLQEFRTRLVADVVTGQVDVRAIAATLPEAPEAFGNSVSATDDDIEEALSEGEE